MTAIPLFENLCCNWENTRYSARVKAAARFCAERHRVYILKAAGEPAPWTNDPILRAYRFCNIYRELDRVTVDIMRDWVRPQVANPNLAIVALIGRVINLPSTLNALTSAGVDFSTSSQQATAWKVFKEIKNDKKRQLVTGAYIVNTVFPKDFPKIDGTKGDYIANFLIPEAWSKRKILAEAMHGGSYRGMMDAYRQVHGIGAFMANQAACDLSYTKFLRSAADLNEVWSPGPGTQKGIRLITEDYELNPGEEMDKALTRYRDDLNHELSAHRWWSDDVKDMRTHIVPLTAPNASNSLCELSKHAWMALGRRDRMKNTYKPGLGA